MDRWVKKNKKTQYIQKKNLHGAARKEDSEQQTLRGDTNCTNNTDLNIFSETLRSFAKSLCVFHSRYPLPASRPPAQDTVKQMQSPLLNANSIFSRSLVQRREICQ